MERALPLLITFARQSTRSPALRSAVALGLGGVGFALANLLLARALSGPEFGRVSLVLSLIQVGAAFGVAGVPTLINRHRWSVTPRLLAICTAGAAAAGLVAAWVARGFYDLSTALALLLAAAIILAALDRVAGAFFQSRERFGVSLTLTQSHNWLLLACVPVVFLLERTQATTVVAVLVIGYLAVTSFGLWLAREEPQESVVVPLARGQWLAEGLSAAGLMLAGNLLFQLDRLLIGALLPLRELATYSVVAVIAGSAFRMLQVGAGYSLAPRLRSCRRKSAALRLIAAEGSLLAAMALLAALAILLLLPWLTERFLSGRYEVTSGLVLVVILTGLVRIWEAVMSAVVSALGSTRELTLLSILGWFTVALSAVCSVAAVRFGLLGVVCGLGVGWGVLAIGASALAARAWSRLA